MNNPARLLAEKLLQSSAVKLQPEMPFVWGSGWNSPIYSDHRRILSYPEIRKDRACADDNRKDTVNTQRPGSVKKTGPGR